MVLLEDQARAQSLTEPVSPELALVDPELARRARALLPHPGEQAALARIAAELVRASELSGAKPSDTRRRSIRPHADRRWLAPLAAAVALVLVALLTDIRVEVGSTLASADPTETEPSSPQTANTPSVPRGEALTAAAPPATPPPGRGATTPAPRARTSPSGTAAPRPQRFAWAPVAGASGYHVELFRGTVKIFQADTNRATLAIPARWQYAGRSQSLKPGTYRWFVWPVTPGRRAGEAVVQASLTVRRG